MFEKEQDFRGSGKTRLLVVDDHPIVRQGLAQLINQEPDFVVAAEAETAEQAVDIIDSQQIDLAIVDISLVGTDGVELTEQIERRWPDLPVLILSMHDELLWAKRAFMAGAGGYVVKREAPGTIVTGLRVMLSGKRYVSEQMARKLVNSNICEDII
jgi:DNA-binding NarL/FixJ family response regulator